MSSFPALVPSPPPPVALGPSVAAAASSASAPTAAAAAPSSPGGMMAASQMVSPRTNKHIRNGGSNGARRSGGGSISAASTTVNAASPGSSSLRQQEEPLSPASCRSTSAMDSATSSVDSPGSHSSSSTATSAHSAMLPSAALSTSAAAIVASAASSAAAAQPGARLGKILSSPRAQKQVSRTSFTSQGGPQLARKSSLQSPPVLSSHASLPLPLQPQPPPLIGPQSPPKRRSDPITARHGRKLTNGQLAALAAAGGPAPAGGGPTPVSRQPSRKENAAAPPRKASVVRQGSNARPTGSYVPGAATTRERLGRNGQPLSRLPSRAPAQPTPIQQYILASKGQLGLMEPASGRTAQRMLNSSSRFDPLMDDDDEQDALVPPSPAQHAASTPTGPSQITALVAAQHAVKKWRAETAASAAAAADGSQTGSAGAATADEGVLHIAAGVMLATTTVTAAALVPVLAQAQARAQASPSTPSTASPTAATANATSAATVSPPKPSTAGAGVALAAPAPSGHNRARSQGGHSRNPSTVSLTDLALSQARRTSWELEHPEEAMGANAQRQAKTAAEEMEQLALAAAQEAAEAAAEAAAAQAAAAAAQATAQAKAQAAAVAAAAAAAALAAITGVPVAAPSSVSAPPAVSVSTPSSLSSGGLGSGSGSDHATPTSAASALSTPSPASAGSTAHVRFSPSAVTGAKQASSSQPNSAGGAGGSSPGAGLQSRSIQHRRMHSRDVDSPLSARAQLPASSPATANHSSTSSPHHSARGKRESSVSSNGDSNPKHGRIERKPSQPNSVSGSPLVAPSVSGSPVLIPAAMLPGPASAVSISPMSQTAAGGAGSSADSFQHSNSATMSPDAVQDRWRRNLIKRMSVNISFAPSPFSGLLGSTAAPAQAANGTATAAAPVASPTLSSAAAPGSPHSGSAGGGHHSRTPSQAAARFALRQSFSPAAAHPPPLAILQLQNSVGPHSTAHAASTSSAAAAIAAAPPGDASQPYPHHPSFSYLFPHQELLAQQREYYTACNQKLLEYCEWNTEQHLDPVVVPASSWAGYQHPTPQPQRRSNGGSHKQGQQRGSGNQSHNGAMVVSGEGSSPLPTSSPSFDGASHAYSFSFPAYAVPPSFPSVFDLDFWRCYSSIQDWSSFDIFQFSELTRGWPLSFMFVIVLKKSNLIERLGLDLKIVFRFIQEVESHYLPNPYHTSIHAADVLHAVYHFLNDSALREAVSDMDKFLLYVSASIHDFAHPGVNNSFLVASKAPLAIRYNDKAVLEAFHVSSTFRMMKLTEGCNILERWENDNSKDGTRVFQRARKLIIDLVLATDLATHFDLVRVMKTRFESIVGEAVAAQAATTAAASAGVSAASAGAGPGTETPPLPPMLSPTPSDSPAPSLSPSVSSPPTAVGTPTPASPSAAVVAAASPSAAAAAVSPLRALSSIRSPEVPRVPLKINLHSDDDLVLVLQLLLKLGDLSHPARPKNLHLRWAELVTEEFFSQGDRERSLNMVPSPFMDRHSTNVATSQMGFLTFLVLPLFQVAGNLQGTAFWTKQVERNLELWGELEKIEQREKTAKEEEERIQKEREASIAAGGGGEHPSAISEGSGSGGSADHSYTGGSIAHLLPAAQSTPDHINPPGGLSSGGGGGDQPHHSPIHSAMRSPLSHGSIATSTPPKSSAGSPLIPGSPGGALMDGGVDLSLYPPSNRAHAQHHMLSSTSVSSAGSGASSAMSSGSGSITGRFSSYCKDRTVLSMFQKVRELGNEFGGGGGGGGAQSQMSHSRLDHSGIGAGDAFDYHADNEEPSLPPHAHAHFEGVNEISRPSSGSLNANAAAALTGQGSMIITFDRMPSVPTATTAAAAAAAGTITEEPLNAQAFTDRDRDDRTPQGSTRTSLERERDAATRPAPIVVTATPWSTSVSPPMQTAGAH